MRWMIGSGAIAGLAAIVVLGGREVPTRVVAQDSSQPEPVQISQLSEGDRFDNESWGLEIQDSFAAASPGRTAYQEIRVAVALQNRTEADLPFQSLAFTGQPGYPTLLLRDGAGETHPINPVQPDLFSVPTSTLVGQPNSIPARWTVGYEVPDPASNNMAVVAVWQGQQVAEWQLTGHGDALYPGWTSPPDVATARLGDGVPWGSSLTVTPLAGDIQVCGDPAISYAVAVYGLAVQVTNTSSQDVFWPNVRFPDDTAIALWADGGSARTGGITTAETFVTEDGESVPTDPLNRRNEEQVVIPPQVTATRMLGFALPRDDRFGSAFLPPQSVMLYPPGSAPIWVDVSGPGLIDFAVDESVCGEFEAAISYQVFPPA